MKKEIAEENVISDLFWDILSEKQFWKKREKQFCWMDTCVLFAEGFVQGLCCSRNRKKLQLIV